MMPQCFNYDRNTNRLVRPRRTRRSSIGAVLAAPSKVNAGFTLTITNVTANFGNVYKDLKIVLINLCLMMVFFSF